MSGVAQHRQLIYPVIHHDYLDARPHNGILPPRWYIGPMSWELKETLALMAYAVSAALLIACLTQMIVRRRFSVRALLMATAAVCIVVAALVTSWEPLPD